MLRRWSSSFRKLLGRGWWRGKDSNLRRPKSADLQSAAFDRSATPPLAFRQRPGDKGLLPLCQRAPSPTALRAAAVFRGGISRRICSTAGAFDKEERLEERNAMARFPEVSPNQYTDEQNELAQKVAGSRGAMRGPFVPALHSPGVLRAIEATGAYVRFHNSLPDDLKELATIVMARFWGAQYEWYAHASLALKAGVDSAIVDAIRQGEAPKDLTPVQAAIYNFVIELN